MLLYSILFNEDNYVYLEIFDDDKNKLNLKIPANQFKDWSKGKMEI